MSDPNDPNYSDGHHLIDRLEDQLIDHPDAETTREIRDTSLDETFQKKLNERAEQIRSNQQSDGSQDNFGTVNYQFLINKYHLQYSYKDLGELDQELSEWLTFNDLDVVGPLEELPKLTSSIEECIANSSNEKLSIDPGVYQPNVTTSDDLSVILQGLIYYSFGEYSNKEDKFEQLYQIIINNEELILRSVYKPLIKLLSNFIEERIQLDKKSIIKPITPIVEQNFFRVLTLIYFIVNVALHLDEVSTVELQEELQKSDLLSTLVKFLEHWKWNPNNSYRIRNSIFLTWKLILLQMGDTAHLKLCDEFLLKVHGIKIRKGTDLNKLTCSSVDYYAFREDIIDKYPLFDTNLGNVHKSEMSKTAETSNELPTEANSNELSTETSSTNEHEPNEKTIEEKYTEFMAMNTHSNSLFNLIETPRTYKSHSVLSQLPTQPVHLATPIPSPTLTPSDYMSGGEKIRRSYQVNQAMPFIYPTLNDTLDDSKLNIPYAIGEADEILKNSIYESYSVKKLWSERQRFMKQERGFKSEYQANDRSEFDYDESLYEKFPEDTACIRSILYVEQFYKNNLTRFYSFVQVLIETIKLNRLDYNLNFPELELNPETSFLANSSINLDTSRPDGASNNRETSRSKVEFVLLLQLEVLNVKELTLKASTGILTSLLKWFKLNHVLKYYYFSSILFDQQFFSVTLDYISRSFNNSNLQRLSNKSEDETRNDADDEEHLSEYEILINQNKIMNPKIELPTFNFFNNCLKKFPVHTYKFINKDLMLQMPKVIDMDNINNTYIQNPNENFCFILSNLLQIMDKLLVKNITQRIFALNELKPSELFKMIVLNYDNEALTKPILKILKKLIPYQGRKWKSINMDLISQIYLNMELSLKDNWLSGKDLESDFNNSYDQEIALRALLQFYNVSRYPKKMELLGYKINLDIDIPLLSLNDVEDDIEPVDDIDG